MSISKSLPDIVRDVYGLLEPLDSVARKRVVDSVLTLLGEQTNETTKANTPEGKSTGVGREANDGAFGPKANRWMSSFGITISAIEEVFHRDATGVTIIANEVPGTGKRQQSLNCYLLSGIRALLETDEPNFSDASAITFCKHIGCFDNANHSKTRADLGNTVAGSKTTGYTLPAPGLRAAALVIKEMKASE
jgi:hypothetical protein